MIFSACKYFVAVALLLLAFGNRIGPPASVRETPLAHRSLPALTAEQVISSETSLPDLSSDLPGRGLRSDRLGGARLSAVPMRENASDPLLATDLAARAPPA